MSQNPNPVSYQVPDQPDHVNQGPRVKQFQLVLSPYFCPWGFSMSLNPNPMSYQVPDYSDQVNRTGWQLLVFYVRDPCTLET